MAAISSLFSVCLIILIIATLQTEVLSSFTAKQSCNFESPVAPGASVYCTASDGVLGWEEQVTEGQGSFGVSTAGAARQGNPDRPLTDYNPGTENGSYFYYVKSINYFNQALLLSYPTQKFIAGLSFSFYMVGPQSLQILQSHVTSFDIISNYSWNGNETVTWERANIEFSTPYPDGNVLFISPSIGGEIGEAPIEREPFLALDDIELTFDLPCDFSLLSNQGNLILSHPSFLDITIGNINTVQFTAISPICTDGPFIYTLDSNNITGLASIFHLNSTTGLLRVNATGQHLIGGGVPLGLITVSVYVQDSGFLQPNGVAFKRHGLLHYRQKPTIIISSPSSIPLALQEGAVGGGGSSFSYTLNASSALNASFSYSISKSFPSSLADNITINGNTVQGIFTHQHLVDVIQHGIAAPSFTILIVDSYGETRNHTVQLILPNTPSLVFNQDEYIIHVSESGSISLNLSNILIGSLPIVQDCSNTIAAQISTTDSVISSKFKLYALPSIPALPNFCTFVLAATTKVFDYEERQEYIFNITANSTLGSSSVAMVTVLVIGVNEYGPVISPKMDTGMISDYEPVGSLVKVLMATDNDEGPDGTLSFSLTQGSTDYFRVQQISNSEAHLETKHSPIEPSEYLVEVTVSDHGTPSMSDTATIIITAIASSEIQCNQSIFGPPVIVSHTPPLRPALNSVVNLQCNYTANPQIYPIKWYRSSLSSPLSFEPISSSSHYTITGNTLTINGVTTNDIQFYTCNITNQCGSNVTSIPLPIVIQPPSPPGGLWITFGPSQHSISLSWTPATITISSPVTSYLVQLKREKEESYQTIQTVNYYTDSYDKASSVNIFQLLPGTGYIVRVASANEYFQSNSNEVNFTTTPSPPLLSFLNATGLSDNSLKIEWILEYTGGSHDVHMMLSVQSNQLKRRRRSFDPVTYSFNVGVNDNVLVTPTLPFGRRYNVMGVVSSEYGTHQLATTAFIGIQDTLSCPFSLSPEDSCGWTVQEPAGSLRLASTVSSPRPTSDARGQSDGVYVLGSIPNDASLETLTLLAYPSISYICSISFYYQVRENVRLRLESSESQNESLIWASSNGDHTRWTHVQIPPEDFPLSVSTSSLLFTMETVDTPSPELSYAAVDDVSLTFCLPCNYSKLTGDSISLSYKNSSIVYIRKDQNITIEATVAECPHPIIQYRIQSIVPNELLERLVIQDQRKGVILISDITTDIAEAGTIGYIIVEAEIVSADYKNIGNPISKSFVISFMIAEFFENCSYIKSCDFESGPCDWKLSDQSDSSIKEIESNSYLYSEPLLDASLSTSNSFIIGHSIINDSYCGLSFSLMKSIDIDLHVLVSGLGVVWSSYSLHESTNTYISSNVTWRDVSVFIDVSSVEIMSGRNVTFEMVPVMTGDDDLSDTFVAIDNVTLHPCVDCEAQECSCISCIQQCTVSPCQDGYYLSLEVNQCRPCPPGYYCENWRSMPKPCPPGTFRNITGGTGFAHCQVCSNGTYTVQYGSATCQTCPTGYNCSNPAVSPVKDCSEVATVLPTTAQQSHSLSLYVAAVVGGFVGVLVIGGTALFIICFCHYQRKHKKMRQRKREHKMYADNFYINPDKDNKRGFKSATVRTASTILSMMGSKTDDGNKAYMNPTYDSDSSDHDSSSIFSSETQASTMRGGGRGEGGKRRLTRDATINSLNSFDVKVDWSDANPFLSDSQSHGNISDIIELEDHNDHVWPALQRKKKEEREEEQDTSINI
ncbi:PREDICTED: uncharacterized protein LOC109581456 [Amphimedon queenslandica]|uniref:Staphylococcus aureus surface protein A n=1 Tax=Amphimedon queenslandica TaxID=400682 RepID=A0AAN0J258_AMPQE|nr:PREDICTED: uncharacterized protein LOC109581456 [Amphimedon queenslandica]|eukprot:XP_019851134.1 PREDICTED: uncharacterized protein LOC109581456 [Amphimedon queenslandica]